MSTENQKRRDRLQKRKKVTLRKGHMFVLDHVYDAGDGRGEQQKTIGTFSRRKFAKAAQARLESQPGFKSRVDGFTIRRCLIDLDGWEEGFIFSWPDGTATDPDDPRVARNTAEAIDMPSWLFIKTGGD